VSVALGLSLFLMACERPAEGPALDDDALVVASFDFPESAVIAELYAGALRAAGYRVEHIERVGTRETVLPALQKGLIDIVPEYAGSALEFLGGHPTAETSATHDALRDALASRGIDALAPATAQNRNAVVVTSTTATELGIRSIADLAGIASELTLGGPPECPDRPLCLPGLEETYGISFGGFIPLDAGGPVTAEAVKRGIVDVGVLFSTDASLAEHGLVLLIDDRGLQPAENVTPIARTEAIQTFGPGVADALDGVSDALTTDDLRAMNAEISSGRTPEQVAHEWLVRKGLIDEAA
jgi:osmoprotectant transport system substrate-binding protein